MTKNKLKNANKSAINVQITRGMCVFGATMLCFFCFFIILMVVIAIFLALMYSSEHLDMQIMINGMYLKLSAVQRNCLPPEIFQNTDHLQDKQLTNEVNDSRTTETIVDELGGDHTSSTDSQVDDQKLFIPQTPIILEVPKFTKRKENKAYWYSKAFFAYEGGYLMRLIVPAAGDNSTHLSVFLQLMKGPYDDILQQSGHFPMYGYFAVELFSQEMVESDLIKIIAPDNTLCSECTNRVTDDIGAMWMGYSNFTSVESLNAYYTKDGSLQFRITYTHYSCYVKAMLFLKKDIFIFLSISVLDGFMVYCLLILVEFIVFSIQESNILIPTCIDFSVGSMKRFLFTKQDVLLGTGYVVLCTTAWILVRFYLISAIELILLGVGEFFFWDLAIAMDNVILVISTVQRFIIIFAFSVVMNQYEMSWREKIVMINPMWIIFVIYII